MAGLLRTMREEAPAAPAIVDDRGALDWSTLDQRVNRWVDLLRAHGLRPGDRVAFVSGNHRATFETLLACLHTGLVAVPVSWRLTAAEIAYILADSGSTALLADRGYAARAGEAATSAELPGPRLLFGGQAAAGLSPAEPMLAQASAAEPAAQCSGSVMLYTSATTGRPKGVVTTLLRPGAGLDRVARTVATVGEAFDIARTGSTLLVGPWYHAAQVFFSLFPLLRGNRLVLRQRFEAAATLADLEREQITFCHLVPTQFIRLLALDAQARARFRGGSLARVWHGGAACPVDVKRRMIEWWGPVVSEYYAATEAGIVTTIDAGQWLARPGSVGRPVPPTELVIVGDDGQEQPAGQAGTVYIRRAGSAGFRYHNAAEKTAGAYRQPGVFTVGDIGYVDEDGFLFLTGRTLETIISGGVNIYPAEVEAALVSHPAVRDAAVFGVPDYEFGERVFAMVEAEPAAGLPAAALPDVLDRHCRGCLAAFKRPRAYEVVEALPREPTGKLDKRRLREPYWQGAR